MVWDQPHISSWGYTSMHMHVNGMDILPLAHVALWGAWHGTCTHGGGLSPNLLVKGTFMQGKDENNIGCAHVGVYSHITS